MIYWLEKSDLTPREQEIIQNFFCFPTWLNMIDAVFFVTTTAEEAIKRDQSVSLTEKFGGTTNPKSLENLVRINEAAYQQKKCLADSPKNIFLINTSGLKITEMTELVLSTALGALENRFK
ncbi:hypothetical protein KKB69_01295 [Patescibacteria group bacterium]|nr:hypothetical protein [Patescibacteria group bacterium]